MWWISAFAWAGGEPTAELSWSPGEAVLRVAAPVGEELSEDGPARLTIEVGPGEIVWSGTGARLDRGVPLGAASGDDVLVYGTFTTCEPKSGYCRPLEVRWRGFVPDDRRGVISLLAEGAPGAGASPYRADAVAAADAAFAQAVRERRLVLLDFGAVWCPPCNRLAAEVLHADPRPEALAGVVVAALDVDDPSSWALKSRYAVGGYPTVVLARADGTELGRLVGYPGEEAWLRWLTETAALGAPAVDPKDRDPAAASPAEAARVARSLVEQGRPADAERWLAHAADGEDLRVARFHHAPSVADAAWLADRGVDPLAWVPGLGDAPTPELAAIARDAIEARLVVAHGIPAAELLNWRAGLASEPEREALYAAATAALRTAMTGEPAEDRAHYTFLASLQASAGDLDGAVAFLDRQSEVYADEPTFDLTAARLLLAANRPADAAVRAERALPRSWGDNHLRVAAQLAAAKTALGDAAGAAEVARAALARVPAPAADLAVRTPRYRAALEAYLPKP